MDAVEFIKQARRMGKAKDEVIYFKLEETETEIVKRIEQWAKEHPVKTRQSEFLKMFPHPRLDRNGCLMICPMDAVGKEYMRDDIPGCINSELDICCEDCCRDFWLKEIE